MLLNRAKKSFVCFECSTPAIFHSSNVIVKRQHQLVCRLIAVDIFWDETRPVVDNNFTYQSRLGFDNKLISNGSYAFVSCLTHHCNSDYRTYQFS